jgi:hypothetical protein
MVVLRMLRERVRSISSRVLPLHLRTASVRR